MLVRCGQQSLALEQTELSTGTATNNQSSPFHLYLTLTLPESTARCSVARVSRLRTETSRLIQTPASLPQLSVLWNSYASTQLAAETTHPLYLLSLWLPRPHHSNSYRCVMSTSDLTERINLRS